MFIEKHTQIIHGFVLVALDKDKFDDLLSEKELLFLLLNEDNLKEGNLLELFC